MRIFEYTFPGEVFDGRAIVIAPDEKKARKKVLKEIEPFYERTFDDLEIGFDLGSVPKRAKIIFFDDGHS